MGWTSTNIYTSGSKLTVKDKKEFLDRTYTFREETRSMRVIKSQFVGSTYYAAVEATRYNLGHEYKEVFAIVTLTQTDNNDYFNFSYKDMSEDMHPYNYDCPMSIINLLTDTTCECALAWRENVRKYHEKKKADKWFKDLPLGSKVRYTKHNGEVVNLIKTPPMAQFKSWFWKIEGCYQYVSKKYVTADKCEVIA